MTLPSIPPRDMVVGDLTVRRLLPHPRRRTIGAWCFLDLMGPLDVGPAEKPMDVPPHPHIGLQTVTWLLAGEALHKDSLDSEALARPGVLNLMTSGRGIAHSEETPTLHPDRLHGVQLWIALPDADRHCAPAFDHYPERPSVELPGARGTVLLGTWAGAHAEARTFSPLMGAEITIEAGAEAVLPLESGFEHGLLPLDGPCESDGERLEAETLYYSAAGRDALRVRTGGGDTTRVLLIGGAPFKESVLMWWNFVARTNDEIVAARDDWEAGRRFGEVRRYAGARLPAPPFAARHVPANPMS